MGRNNSSKLIGNISRIRCTWSISRLALNESMAWYLFRMRVSPRVSSLHSKQIPCHALSVLFRPTNEFQTTRFNWIKPRPTRNQLTSTRLSTPFLIPFRIINLSPSINRRRIAIVCTKILYPLLLSPLCNPISREFFSTIPSSPTHTIPRNFHQTHEFQIRSKCLSSEVPPPRVTLTRTLSSKLSIAGNVLILK